MLICTPPDGTLSLKLVIFDFYTFLLWGKMVDKVDLEASRCDLKPHIRQFGYLEPFVSTCIFFYFSTGGRMVEQVFLKASRCDLKPKIGHFRHLELFFLGFHFSTQGRWV